MADLFTLAVRVKFLSDNTETTYSAACVFCCINLEDNCNKFDGIVQTNLSRDKFQTNHESLCTRNTGHYDFTQVVILVKCNIIVFFCMHNAVI